jgi:hypothetical protein
MTVAAVLADFLAVVVGHHQQGPIEHSPSVQLQRNRSSCKS